MRTFRSVVALVAVTGIATLLLMPVPAVAAESGAIALVDAATDGTPGNGGVGGSDISDDGRYVAFASTSDNLVPGDTNENTDIFVRDTETGTTTLVSGGLNGQLRTTTVSARPCGASRSVACPTHPLRGEPWTRIR
ncbi:hypothetical protein ACWD5Z_26620 [Micromonospora chokoriensis]